MEAKSILKMRLMFSSIRLIILAVSGLLFKTTLYWKIPVASGDPYGFGDVIEMFICFVNISTNSA